MPNPTPEDIESEMAQRALEGDPCANQADMPEPAALYEDGQLWWRGVYRTRSDMIRLHAQFSHTLAGDWFAPHSLQFAAQIAEAVRQYDEDHA